VTGPPIDEARRVLDVCGQEGCENLATHHFVWYDVIATELPGLCDEHAADWDAALAASGEAE
jgi:hypothetical protein